VGCGGDGGVCAGRGAIKGQDAITEIFVQQALDRGGESLATLSCGKDGHAVPKLGFADSAEVDLCPVLCRQPSLDRLGWV